MSKSIIKEEIIKSIDDVQNLNYVECLGFIFDALSFNKFKFKFDTITIGDIINKMSFIASFFKEEDGYYRLSYNSNFKTVIVDFGNKYRFIFIPKGKEGIEIELKEKVSIDKYLTIASANYSINDIEENIFV